VSEKLLHILMVLAMVAWGETWISAKVLSHYISSAEAIFFRFFFTTLGLLPILLLNKEQFKISMKNFIIVAVSALLLALYNGAFFLGTKYGLASVGGVLVTTLTPINTFLLIALVSKKLITKIEFFGLILGFIGALVMLKIWHFNSGSLLTHGNSYYLLATILWPLLTLVSSKQSGISPLLYSFYMFALTSLIVLAFLGFRVTNIFYLDHVFWLNMLLLSLYGTTFATTIYFLAVVDLGSKTASSFFFLVPVSALFFAVIFLKERVDFTLVSGGILSIMAVYIINFAKGRDEK
jgi:drug/metabolite transporter (DMT)-like permease